MACKQVLFLFGERLMSDIHASEETQITVKKLIHKLNGYLAILYGNIEVSILSMQNKEFMGENIDVIELLTEAHATKDEVKAIISMLSESINGSS